MKVEDPIFWINESLRSQRKLKRLGPQMLHPEEIKVAKTPKNLTLPAIMRRLTFDFRNSQKIDMKNESPLQNRK